MKKIYILSLLALGLTGCHTMNRAPYSGGVGEYGFTYDLEGTPSPFVDTAYRPLTSYDLGAPIVVIVTNQPPPKLIYATAPEIGATTYSGETPPRAVVVYGSPQINEPAGAQRGTSGAGGVGADAAPGSGGANYFSAPSVFVGGGSVTNTNNIPTNNIPTNGIPTNGIPTNNIPTNNIPTNNVPTNNIPTNRPPFPTNTPPTNAFPDTRTNQLGRREAPAGFTNRSLPLNEGQPATPAQPPSINDPSGSPASPPVLAPNQPPAMRQSVPFGVGSPRGQSPAPRAPAPASPAPASPAPAAPASRGATP